MKAYPKVPRHDLPFVPDELFEAEDLYLLEKMDGGNFRFMLYEERFKDEYEDDVLQYNPSDGDLIFGSKGVVRGIVSDPIHNFDSDFHAGIFALRSIPTDTIRQIHDDYGPLVWFVEHMVPHTIDYNYTSDPPPAIIGFDVYTPRDDDRESEDFPSNPYREKFIGYLDVETARELFERIGVQFTPIVQSPEEFGSVFDPNDFDVPESEYASRQAEGVVIRSDSLQVRSKLVTEEFRELHKMSMGGNPSEADTPIEWIVDSLITTARIRKHSRRLIMDEGYEFSTQDKFVELVTEQVLVDAWTEEFVEIQDIDEPIIPADVHDPAKERVRHVLERMEQMGARTDSDPTMAWTSIDGNMKAEPQTIQRTIASDIESDVKAKINHGLTPEDALIDVLVGDSQYIQEQLFELESDDGRDLDGWAVTPAVDMLMDQFWVSDKSKASLWCLSIEFTPIKVKNRVREKVRNQIEEIAEVDLDSGGESWEPDSDYNTDGLGNIF